MKKLTKKERNKIYLQASKLIGENGVSFACWALLLAKIGKTSRWELPRNKFNQEEVLKDFPEFQLFEPTQENIKEYEDVSSEVWFEDYNNKENGYNMRKIALLLCYEMTKL